MSERDAPERRRMERYLLGDLSAEERAEIEQGYFADDDEFERMMEVHTDLVDAYARGELTPEEKVRFDRRLLTSASDVDRAQFASALAEKTPRKPIAFRGLRTMAIAAAAAAVIVIALGWLVFALRERTPATPIPASVQAAPVDRHKAVSTAIQDQSAHAPQIPAAPEVTVMTVVLTPHGTRESDAATDLILHQAPQSIELQLLLDDNRYDRFAFELQDVEGHVLWTERALTAKTGPSGSVVKVRVPARLLPAGDYVVVLRGLQGGTSVEISNYTFTVVARPAGR